MARVNKFYHIGVPINFESVSRRIDDNTSWTDLFNNKRPKWMAAEDFPEVKGTVYITGIQTYLIGPNDPIKNGFILR